MPGLLDVSCVVVWHSEILPGYFYSRNLLYFSKDTAMLHTLTGSLYALPITLRYIQNKNISLQAS